MPPFIPQVLKVENLGNVLYVGNKILSELLYHTTNVLQIDLYYDNEFGYLKMGKFWFFFFHYQDKMLNKGKKLSLENYIRTAVMPPVFLIDYLANCLQFGTRLDWTNCTAVLYNF